MENNQRKTIRKEIVEQLETIENYRAMASMKMAGFDRIVNHMEASTASKDFFSITDVDKLLFMYEAEVDRVSGDIGNSNFTTKQKVLNFLEYIRLNGMYDNLDNKKFSFQNMVSLISQSGINIALLGKGVCASQSKFLRDLLNDIGENAMTGRVDFLDVDTGMSVDAHGITYLKSTDGQTWFLDPTWYNGTTRSVKGSLNSADLSEEKKKQLSSLNVTQEEIDEARNVVQGYLIKRFGIKEISEQLGLEQVGDLEKQIRILAFMERNLAPASEELNFRSVVLGKREIEVGKLLELFYKSNDIQYKLECDGDKSHTRYTTNIDGKECTIKPEEAFNKVKNNGKALSRCLHWTKNEHGESKYLWSFSKEQEEEMLNLIRNSRKIAESVIIPEEETSIIQKQNDNRKSFSEDEISTEISGIRQGEINKVTMQLAHESFCMKGISKVTYDKENEHTELQ